VRGSRPLPSDTLLILGAGASAASHVSTFHHLAKRFGVSAASVLTAATEGKDPFEVLANRAARQPEVMRYL